MPGSALGAFAVGPRAGFASCRALCRILDRARRVRPRYRGHSSWRSRRRACATPPSRQAARAGRARQLAYPGRRDSDVSLRDRSATERHVHDLGNFFGLDAQRRVARRRSSETWQTSLRRSIFRRSKFLSTSGKTKGSSTGTTAFCLWPRATQGNGSVLHQITRSSSSTCRSTGSCPSPKTRFSRRIIGATSTASTPPTAQRPVSRSCAVRHALWPRS